MRGFSSLPLGVVHLLLGTLLVLDISLGTRVVSMLAGEPATLGYDLVVITGYALVAASFRHRETAVED